MSGLVPRLALAALVPLTIRSAHAAPPDNDDLIDAAVVTSLPFIDQVDTTEATPEPDDPDCAGNGPTVWYRFTPENDTSVRVFVNTFGSDYDTTLSVYTSPPSLDTQLACNDDFDSLQSGVLFDAQGGGTYFIMAGAFASGSGGSLMLQIDVAPPPLDISLTLDPTGTFVPQKGLASVSGTVFCSRSTEILLTGTLRQQINHVFLDGSFETIFPCDGETDWAVALQPENGLFKGGKAFLQVFASTIDFFDFDEDFAQRDIKLVGNKE